MAEAPNPPARRRRSRRGSAVERVRKTDFPVALRGYDRQAVDRYVAEVAQLVAELEATQTREGVVQRALDEVGEQTSGILQHAHETAEEIAARSRAQAEGRLQRAEHEAEEARREADRYAEHVVDDIQRLWEERQRLIEDMRQLADEVLGVADDALERLDQPDTGFAGVADGEDEGDVSAPQGLPSAEQAEHGSGEAGGPPERPQPEGPAREAPGGPVADEPPDPDTTAVWPEARPPDDTTSELPAPAARERGD